jgi:hypothetical protein
VREMGSQLEHLFSVSECLFTPPMHLPLLGLALLPEVSMELGPFVCANRQPLWATTISSLAERLLAICAPGDTVISILQLKGCILSFCSIYVA